MAMIKVKDVYKATFSAQPEFNFQDKDGKDVKIEAREAREASIVLGELEDGTVFNFEIPADYKNPVNVGDTMNVQCKNIDMYQRPLHVKAIMRHIPKGVK